MHIGYWWERQKERDNHVGGWTILKWILDGMDESIRLRIGSSGGLL
jgi:hypothetical protein